MYRVDKVSRSAYSRPSVLRVFKNRKGRYFSKRMTAPREADRVLVIPLINENTIVLGDVVVEYDKAYLLLSNPRLSEKELEEVRKYKYTLAGIEALAEGKVYKVKPPEIIIRRKYGRKEALDTIMGVVGQPFAGEVSFKLGFKPGKRDEVSITIMPEMLLEQEFTSREEAEEKLRELEEKLEKWKKQVLEYLGVGVGEYEYKPGEIIEQQTLLPVPPELVPLNKVIEEKETTKTED